MHGSFVKYGYCILFRLPAEMRLSDIAPPVPNSAVYAQTKVYSERGYIARAHAGSGRKGHSREFGHTHASRINLFIT